VRFLELCAILVKVMNFEERRVLLLDELLRIVPSTATVAHRNGKLHAAHKRSTEQACTTILTEGKSHYQWREDHE